MLDRLKDDMLHILVNLYVYNYKSENILKNSGTDFELRYEIIALNAMAENIAIRIARMFDGSNGARSFKKLDNYKKDKLFRNKIDNFIRNDGKELIIKRNTELAHINERKVVSYPIIQLPAYITESISFAMNTLDGLAGSNIQYTYRYSSTTKTINFKNELCK